MDEWGGANVAFLSEDGECVSFCVIADPVLLSGKFQGRDTERIGAPVVTVDGYTLLVIGKRVARKLAKHEKDFGSHALEIIRHGESGDTKTKYTVQRCQDPEVSEILLAMAKTGVNESDIEESVKEAFEIAQG